MEFKTVSSPHFHTHTSVSGMMGDVLIALVPALFGLVWFFGFGVVVNIATAVIVALIAEAGMITARNRPVIPAWRDLSATLTAVLLAMALPPFSPWWMTAVGSAFSIIFAKHLYGGLGYNPFNPAMVGYVLLLVSFPREMTQWLPPVDVFSRWLGPLDSINLIFNGYTMGGLTVDAISHATPLDTLRQQIGLHHTVSEAMRMSPVFGTMGGKGWEWVNFLYLIGGVWMIWRRTITWHIPAGMLGTLFIVATLFYGVDADRYASPLFHIFSGASLFGAFFIATDPVSAATTPQGRVIFGAGIGILVYLIRTFGGYPDAVAFAVLVMNIAAPTIDQYTQPRVYGHR
ncbi:SoxR (2Fe-2S) reducing system protein RsxD [Gammaproteobacteria bacterium]